MDPKIGIVIQARMGSKRLPCKSLKKIGDFPVIEWVIRACKTIRNIERVILATSKDKNCDKLVEYVEELGIEVFRGDEENVLSRFKNIIGIFDFDIVIRITGDDPCHDPILIEKAINQFQKTKLEYLISHFKESSITDGLIFEIISRKLFLEIYDNYKDDLNTQEHVTFPIRKYNYKSKQNFLNREFFKPLYADQGIKICVDNYEDLERLRKHWVTKNLRNIEIADTEKILNNIYSK